MSEIISYDRRGVSTINDLVIKDADGVEMLFSEAEEKLVAWQESMNILKECIDDLKADIMRAMETNNIVKIDTDHVLINYIAETEKETFQTKKFKTDHQELYDEYCKLTTVAPQIRLKVKE